MGVRILHDEKSEQAVMYCSTSDHAFGPVFGPRFDKGPDERIERFCDWLVIDPRSIDAASLERKYLEWHDQEKNQYEREDEKVEP